MTRTVYRTVLVQRASILGDNRPPVPPATGTRRCPPARRGAPHASLSAHDLTQPLAQVPRQRRLVLRCPRPQLLMRGQLHPDRYLEGPLKLPDHVISSPCSPAGGRGEARRRQHSSELELGLSRAACELSTSGPNNRPWPSFRDGVTGERANGGPWRALMRSRMASLASRDSLTRALSSMFCSISIRS